MNIFEKYLSKINELILDKKNILKLKESSTLAINEKSKELIKRKYLSSSTNINIKKQQTILGTAVDFYVVGLGGP